MNGMDDVRMEMEFKVWEHLERKRRSAMRSDGERQSQGKRRKMAKGTVTFRRERDHPDRSEGREGVQGDRGQKGRLGQAKSFGVYSRGLEEPSKMLGKL